MNGVSPIGARLLILATVITSEIGSAGLAAVSGAGLQVAQPPPTFEVASIKLNTSGSPERFGGFQPGGRLRAVNVPLRQIIAWAYGDSFPVPDQQIIGGPSWVDNDRYDVEAGAAGDPPREQMQLMLRGLLADRFKLVSREVTRDLPIYRLVTSRPDGSLGPRLMRSTGDDCAKPGAPPQPAQRICGSVGFVGGRGSARTATMDAVARFLVPAVGRIVVNETGLSGAYSFDVEFAPTRLNAAASDVAADPGPSLFTVLPEQLGLKLEASTAPTPVLVIGTLERPTEN